LASRSVLGTSRTVHPDSTLIILAEHETNAKCLRVRPSMTETKQHVKGYTQSATDEPFLNRVSQVRILSESPTRSEGLDEAARLFCRRAVFGAASDSTHNRRRTSVPNVCPNGSGLLV
jgi:hypothetical protein